MDITSETYTAEILPVTSAKYTTDPTTIEAVINSITICVPVEPTNRHYRAIQAWVEEGNTIEELA
jgi:hypothetical protein